MGGNEIAELEGMQVASEEGMRVTDHLSLLTNFTTGGLYDDSTIYMLDRQIFGITNNANLPPPRSQQESLWTDGLPLSLRQQLPDVERIFPGPQRERRRIAAAGSADHQPQHLRLHLQQRVESGRAHLGNGWLAFNTGLQFTLRRDTEAPQYMNQNLFRQFVYVNSSSFGNWLSFNGSMYHEAGPFTATTYKLNSNDVGETSQFTVGRPWGKTAFITGYTRRDLTFSPTCSQFFTTSTYAGIQRKFGQKLTASVAGRIHPLLADAGHAASQRRKRCARRNDSIQAEQFVEFDGQFAWTRGEAFQEYDNVYSSFFITYIRPFHRTFSGDAGDFKVAYPLRFSVGSAGRAISDFTGTAQSGTLHSSRFSPVDFLDARGVHEDLFGDSLPAQPARA